MRKKGWFYALLLAVRAKVESKKTRTFFRIPKIITNHGEEQSIGVPTVALGKKKCVEKDHEKATERALRAKKRRQQTIERAELEAAEKKKCARKWCSNRKNRLQ